MKRFAPAIAGTLAALLLLFGAYMGSYYAMLEEMAVGAQYRVGGRLVSVFYLPANTLDRLFRPGYWGEE